MSVETSSAPTGSQGTLRAGPAGRRRRAQRRLRRGRPGRRPGGAAAARLAVRHPQLRRGRADAGGERLSRDRAVPARLRHDALPRPTTASATASRRRWRSTRSRCWTRSGSIGRSSAGFDWGARTADVMAALWPERCTRAGLGERLPDRQPGGRGRRRCRPRPSCSGGTSTTSPPSAAGPVRAATGASSRKLIWRTASPKWDFDDATFDRSAAAFDNPDHVDIVIHNYRWRLGLADGEPEYDDLEQRLAEAPAIAVPTITLEGDANGAPHPEPGALRRASSRAPTAHRTIEGGIGHNLPQEAPEAFADAIIDGRCGAMSSSRASHAAVAGQRAASRASTARPAGSTRRRSPRTACAETSCWSTSGRYTCINWLRTLALRPGVGRAGTATTAWWWSASTRPEFPFEHDVENVRAAVERRAGRLPGRARQRLRGLARLRQPLLAGALPRRRRGAHPRTTTSARARTRSASG